LDLVMPTNQTRRLLHVKDSIDARYAEPLDVRALAGIAGISSAHFSRQFRQAFGEPPHEYLRSRRMERATALLRNTDDPVRDICNSVGLRSVGSFTTSFGRAYGLSPAAYRAKHRRGTVAAAIPPCALRKWARPRPRAPRPQSPTRGGALRRS
jgi:AraC-like DNA-binding protein